MAKTGWTSKGQGQANPTITHPVTRRSLLSPPSTKGLPPVMGQLCNKMKLLSDKIPAHVKTCQLLHQLPYHIFLALLLKQSNKFHSLFKDPMNFSQIFKPWNLDFQFQRLSTTITVCMNPVCTMPCLVLVLVAWRFKIKREWKERNLFLVGHIHMVIPSLWFFGKTEVQQLLTTCYPVCIYSVVAAVVLRLGLLVFFFNILFSQRALSHSWKTLQDLLPDPVKKRQHSSLVGACPTEVTTTA